MHKGISIDELVKMLLAYNSRKPQAAIRDTDAGGEPQDILQCAQSTIRCIIMEPAEMI